MPLTKSSNASDSAHAARAPCWARLLPAVLGLAFGVAQAQGDAAAGKELAVTCAACHGADGNSPDPQWPSLAGQHARYVTKQLAAFKEGEARNNAIMAGFAVALSEEDMADLGAYFATQTPQPNFAEGDAETIARGARLYRAGDAENGIPACMACHGPAGAGDPLGGFPKLSGQHAAYIASQLTAFRAGERRNDANAMMRGAAMRLRDADVEALSQYIAGLHD